MIATYRLCKKDLDQTHAALTVTMTLAQWRELNKQLGNEWPSWKFGSQISTMIQDAEKLWYAEDTSHE